MSDKEWYDWLDRIPDEEVAGFGSKAQAWTEQYARNTRDKLLESCFSYHDNNPRRWLEETYDVITCSCKSDDEAGTILMKLYEEVTRNDE